MWKVIPASEAVSRELSQLAPSQKIKDECKNLVRILSEEDNPAEPLNPLLHVKHLEHDARDWYRLKVIQHNIRIVFSLHYEQGNTLARYGFREIPYETGQNYIVVRFAGYRTDDTYVEVHRRWQQAGW